MFKRKPVPLRSLPSHIPSPYTTPHHLAYLSLLFIEAPKKACTPGNSLNWGNGVVRDYSASKPARALTFANLAARHKNATVNHIGPWYLNTLTSLMFQGKRE